eukprot:TRINITY_DN11751_c1_g1_i6.p1 TRINITY_DN11751_c1_g1~~TRINITY_DN11751_c1_g1_i6.p1  ORF type:complete len:339 (-),score=5.18 TRINITY_DN11751_c1_g1_i6:242-1204(-)
MNMNNMFVAPEFKHVLKRICEKQDKKGYYVLRKLNKFHQEQFESKMESMDVQFQNLKSVAESTLANHLKVLNISIFEDVHNLNNLCYILPAFFPNIQNVNVHLKELDQITSLLKETGAYFPKTKRLTLTEHLVLKNLNLSVDDSILIRHQFYTLEIYGQYDISINDCVFNGFNILLYNNNNIKVNNSIFENKSGLSVMSNNGNAIVMEDVKFVNCFRGLDISVTQAHVTLKKIQSLKCEIGLNLQLVQNGFYLYDSELIDCEVGIFCVGCVGRVQNCIVRGCQVVGVKLSDSTVHHNGVQLYSNRLNIYTGENSSFIQHV